MIAEPQHEWTPYVVEHPPAGALCRFLCEYNGQQWTGYVQDNDFRVNARKAGPAYLWWKLTALERFKDDLWDRRSDGKRRGA